MHLKPEEIPGHMLANDAYSQWMGIEIESVSVGTCVISMTIREEMTNSMGMAHGGISYSFADTAFGFASNTHGIKAVSIETSINHIEALEVGDKIRAKAQLESLKNRLGFYSIRIWRNKDLVALFKGTVYRTKNEW
jgi:acyl-CoA thioesterase